jgi:hypothetical protein
MPRVKAPLGADVSDIGDVAERKAHCDHHQGSRFDGNFLQREAVSQRLDEIHPLPAASAARAAAIASYSRRPPPIEPKNPPSDCKTMRAPLSRGTEPAAQTALRRAVLPFFFA